VLARDGQGGLGAEGDGEAEEEALAEEVLPDAVGLGEGEADAGDYGAGRAAEVEALGALG
jgi:hypothetical protein